MNTKKKIILSFIISLIGFGVGFILTNSTNYGICISNETITEASCINLYERLGDPLFYGMFALAVVFLILLFSQNSFSVWKKFAKWFIPIATLIFVFYDGPSSGDYFSPYPEQVFLWISILYVLVSALIILFHSKKD